MEVITWSIIFGVFGLPYFMYGKSQEEYVWLVCGILLMIFPYFISNLTIMIVVGITLIILPFIAKRFF